VFGVWGLALELVGFSKFGCLNSDALIFEITSFQPSTVDRANDDSRRADAPIASSLCLFRV